MPKGPNGQKRPADVIGAAVMVARIATGEAKESGSYSGTPNNHPVIESARLGGLKGGKTRAERLTSEERSGIARAAAAARWSKREPNDNDPEPE